MAKKTKTVKTVRSVTIKAAWIGGICLIVATLIAAVLSGPSDAIKQTATQSGTGNVLNQAGRDIVNNQGISEETMKELLREKSHAANKELMDKYTNGYFMVGFRANGMVAFHSDTLKIEGDWNNMRFGVDEIRNTFSVYIEKLTISKGDGDSFTFSKIGYHGLPFTGENTPIAPIFQLQASPHFFEVIDKAKGIYLVGFN